MNQNNTVSSITAKLNVMEIAHSIEASQKFKFERDFAVWARKASSILTPTTVLFAIVRDYSFVKTSLNSILDHLKSLNLFHLAISASHMPNTNFHCIHFENEAAAADFTNRSEFINQDRVKFITGQEETRQVRITIENFPPHLIEELITPALSQVGTVVKVSPQAVPSGKETFCMIGRTVIEFLFHETKTLKDLPYHIHLLGHKCFLYVPGRPRICFRCSSELHIVANCPLRYCRVCHALKNIGHVCVKTYADRVAGPVADWEERNARLLEDQLLIDLDTFEPPLVSELPPQDIPPEIDTEITSSEAIKQMQPAAKQCAEKLTLHNNTSASTSVEFSQTKTEIKKVQPSNPAEAEPCPLSAVLVKPQSPRVPKDRAANVNTTTGKDRAANVNKNANTNSAPSAPQQTPGAEALAATTQQSPAIPKRSLPKSDPIAENTRSKFKKQRDAPQKHRIVSPTLLKEFIGNEKPKLQPLTISKKTRKLQAMAWGDVPPDNPDLTPTSQHEVGDMDFSPTAP